MNKIKNVLLLTGLAVSVFSLSLASTNIQKTNAASYEYPWYEAFLVDSDNDGDEEIVPLIFKGQTSMTYKFFYELIKLDCDKYDYPWEEEELYWLLYEEFYQKYGVYPDFPDEEPYCFIYLAEKYGSDSEIYKQAEEEYYAWLQLVEIFIEKSALAEDLYQKDLEAQIAANPGILWDHQINEKLTFTEEKDEELLYWLHVPFDYDPNKSYPVIITANGESVYWQKDKYIDLETHEYLDELLCPPDNWQMSHFYNQWWEKVKNPGPDREKYDCFFIPILNTNEFYRGYSQKGPNRETAIGISAQSDDYFSDDIYNYNEYVQNTDYRAWYSDTYKASELSPAYQEQLVCQLIDYLAQNYNIDKSRQYVTGFSLGGCFTNDIIYHYPERFAAAMPVCSASSDISESNALNLTNTNYWAISGGDDHTCSKYHSIYMTNAINDAREKYQTGSNHYAQYSVFSGGHTGAHWKNTIRNAKEGVSITNKDQIIDFFFNSVRENPTNKPTHNGTIDDPYIVKDAVNCNNKNYNGETEDVVIKGIVKKVNEDATFDIFDSDNPNMILKVKTKERINDINTQIAANYPVIIKGDLSHSNTVVSSEIKVTPYKEAYAFANVFNQELEPICVNTQGNSKPNDELIEKWIQLEDIYYNLTTEEKDIVSKTTADQEGSTLEKCIAKYDYITNKYPSLDRFIKPLEKLNTSNQSFEEDTKIFGIALTIITPAIALISFGLVRRRKRKSA